jgi:pilus assembly protein CpaF
MRPDRIIVGEVRGPEALDLLSALSTGHAGSLCTIHAGSAAEALRRLETLALMADVGLPLAAIRDQVADAIDLVVCQARGADGVRRVVEVAEVVRAPGGPGVRQLFRLRDGREEWRAAGAGRALVGARDEAAPVPADGATGDERAPVAAPGATGDEPAPVPADGATGDEPAPVPPHGATGAATVPVPAAATGAGRLPFLPPSAGGS